MKENKLLNAAIAYHKAGFNIVPYYINKDGNKAPALKNPNKYRDERASLEQVKKWFTTPTNTHLTIYTEPYKFFAIDIDTKNHLDENGERLGDDIGQEFLNIVKNEKPELYKRLVAETSPSGGVHIFFSAGSEFIKTTVLARGATGKPIIEHMAANGKITVYPSPGYKMIKGNIAEINTIHRDDHEYLRIRAEEFNNYVDPEPVGPYNQVNDGTRPGDDFNRRGAGVIRDMLLADGWTEVEGRPGDWLRPGKTRPPRSASLNERAGRFKVWTTAAGKFEKIGYSFHALYTLIKYGTLSEENFIKSTRELANMGYGEPTKSTSHNKQLSEVNRPDADAPAPDPEDDTTKLKPIDFKDMAKHGNIVRGFMPKFIDMQSTYHGLHGVAILTGDSWTGKSLIAQRFAVDFVNQTIPCLYYSLEMDADLLAKRLLTMQLGDKHQEIGIVPPDINNTYKNFKEYVEQYHQHLAPFEMGFYIRDYLDNVESIAADIDEVRAQTMVNNIFVVIDYLQLVIAPGSSQKDRLDYILAKLRQIYNSKNHPDGKLVILVLSEITKSTGDAVKYDDDVKSHKEVLFRGAMGTAQIHYAADMLFTILRHPTNNESKLVFLKNKIGKLPNKNPITLQFTDAGLRYEEQ